MKNLLGKIHGGLVHSRRVRVLANLLADLIAPHSRVLDIGCGDGLLAHHIMELRSDIEIEGLDVLVRPRTFVKVHSFDGCTIPRDSGSYDAVMLVDVVHHLEDPVPLLREVVRVARNHVLIKDHTRNGLLAGPTLRVMDFLGNAHHGVALPFNYWPRARWQATIGELGLRVSEWRDRLGLYPIPADWLFGRSLHFLARLERSGHLDQHPNADRVRQLSSKAGSHQ